MNVMFIKNGENKNQAFALKIIERTAEKRERCE